MPGLCFSLVCGSRDLLETLPNNTQKGGGIVTAYIGLEDKGPHRFSEHLLLKVHSCEKIFISVRVVFCLGKLSTSRGGLRS